MAGQAKTTTAVHLVALFNQRGPTLLVDGHPNRCATRWHQRKGFPFKVVNEKQAMRFASDFEHVVMDMQAQPTKEDLKLLAGGCDLLIVPLTPDALSLDALFLFTDTLDIMDTDRFKILPTIVPPLPSREGEELVSDLNEAGLPVFKTGIRRSKAFQKAALDGVLVKDVSDPYASEAWRDYQTIAMEVLR